MTKPRFPPLLYGTLLALCLLPGAAIFASINWLKQQPQDTAFLITGVGGAVTLAAALALQILHDRGMDEWERSNSRFSSFWGDALGTTLVGLLLLIPAGRDWIVATVTNFADSQQSDQLVILGFVGGFMALCVGRMLCMVVLSLTWTFWKSRAPRATS
jgi:hypothetical protein